MDWSPLNTISSSDNFFKFMTMSGIVILLIALFYPTHMQNQLELDILRFEQDSLLLDLEAELTLNEVNHLKDQIDSAKAKIVKLRENKTSENEIKNIKLNIQKIYDLLIPKKKIILTKSTIQSYNKKKIKLIQCQIDRYKNYKSWLTFISSAFILIGGFLWARSQNVTEKIKRKQL